MRPPGLSCVDQRLRHARRRGGDHDGVERRLFRPALVAVADPDFDIAVAELFQPLAARSFPSDSMISIE